MTLFAH